MLTITPEALTFIQIKKQPIFLEMPKPITSCCFDCQECPTVHFGKPNNMSQYNEKTIQDVTIFIPHRLPNNYPLTITVNSFFSLKRLVLEGWCMV
jgi:hypothetical protein